MPGIARPAGGVGWDMEQRRLANGNHDHWKRKRRQS